MKNKVDILKSQYDINKVYDNVSIVKNSIETNVLYELDYSRWNCSAKNRLKNHLVKLNLEMTEFQKKLKEAEDSLLEIKKIDNLNDQIEMLEKENENLQLSLNPTDKLKITENNNKIEEMKIEIKKIENQCKLRWEQ